MQERAATLITTLSDLALVLWSMVMWSMSVSTLVPVVTEGNSQQWPLVYNCLPCGWCPGSSCEIPVNAYMHQRQLVIPRETRHCRLSATKRAFLTPGKAQSSSLPQELLIHNAPVLSSLRAQAEDWLSLHSLHSLRSAWSSSLFQHPHPKPVYILAPSTSHSYLN